MSDPVRVFCTAKYGADGCARLLEQGVISVAILKLLAEPWQDLSWWSENKFHQFHLRDTIRKSAWFTDEERASLKKADSAYERKQEKEKEKK